MTNQEAFDKVWEHFVVNGGPFSRSDNAGGCAYRGDGGARCAMGVLIPDEMYSTDMEGTRASSVIEKFPALKGLVDGRFADKLQGCHDDTSTPNFRNDIESNLRDLAEIYKLAIPAAA